MAIPQQSTIPGGDDDGRRIAPALPLTVLLVAGLAAVLVGGAVGGAFVALSGFDDGGALARYGVPVLRTVHDVLAAATVGLLLIAGTVVPERASTDRRGVACRLAVLTGSGWALAGLGHLLLVVANVSGLTLRSPEYAAQLARLWDIEFFRVLGVGVLLALAATVGAALARTRFAITWTAVIAFAGTVVLALVGHAAGSADHDTAVNSLGVHIGAALVWAGGLAALVVLRPALGSDLAVCVSRFSVLALWCYVAVALSGVLNAAPLLGSPAGLATTYGALVIAKVVAFLLLGVAGWRMRRHVVDRIARDDRAASAFASLALAELALMGVAMGLGSAMSRSAPPVPQGESADVATALTGHPAPAGPPSGLDWFTTVRIDWLFLAVAALGIGLYLAGIVRLRRRGDEWQVGRTIAWVLGWLFFCWVTSGAPAVYGRVTFSAHMLMHMMLTMGVPLLLVLGAPITLAARTLAPRKDKTLGPRELVLAVAHSRWMSFWANPVVAAANFVGSLYLFYFTPLFELALTTHVGHLLMVTHFMLAGYTFGWCLVGVDPGPRRWAPSLRLVLLFATMSFHAFFGLALVSGTSLLGGDFFTRLALPWVPDPLADQVEGGLITWGIGEVPMLALALAVAFVWMRSDEAEARRRDRQADRDDDAELAAYNADLARRAEASRRVR